MPSSFEADYPAITRWVKRSGRIEIGSNDGRRTFVRAWDEGGVVWEGAGRYETLDEAFRAMEEGLKEFIEKQGLDRRLSPKPRPSRGSPKRHRKPQSDAGSDRNRSEGERKVVKKVEKLEEIAQSLRQGGHFSITRLTALKGLCEDPKAAGAFALFLARKIQKRMREKQSPERYRALVNRAVREMKPFLEDPTEERRERLWSLFREIESEQNEYERISRNMVRNVKSFDLLVVEHTLRAVLRPYEAPFWLYHAARDYTGKTDELVPKSASMVGEIAGFWRKYFGIKR
jgi:hypothetical protein